MRTACNECSFSSVMVSGVDKAGTPKRPLTQLSPKTFVNITMHNATMPDLSVTE